jgi:HAD superfamily hydrolase (TIGR01509 family)
MSTRSSPVRTVSAAESWAAERLAPPEAARALIFDWDGTLADTAGLNCRALCRALRLQRATVPTGWHAEHAGLSIEDQLSALSSHLERELDIDAVVTARDSYLLSHLQEITAHPAVLAIAERAVGRLPLAIATGNHRHLVEPALRALGIAGLFDAVITRDDVYAGKPAPDLFLLAARAVNVSPVGSHVYEDTTEGLAAATAAGMTSTDVRPALAAGSSLLTPAEMSQHGPTTRSPPVNT